MSDDEIHDEIRMSTDSSIQALTTLVRDLQNDNRKHRQEELESRQAYRMEMLNTVENIVKVTVNGKIDAANKKLDMLIERSEPVLTQYEERKGFWATMSNYSKSVGLVAALVASSIYILKLLTK